MLGASLGLLLYGEVSVISMTRFRHKLNYVLKHFRETHSYGMPNVALFDIFIFLSDLTSLLWYILGFVFNIWQFLFYMFHFYSIICIQYIRLFLLYNFRLYCIFSHLHCIFLDLYLISDHFYSILLHYYCIFLDLYLISGHFYYI